MRAILFAVRAPFAPACLVIGLGGCWTPPRPVPALPAPLPAQGAAFGTTAFPEARAPEHPVEAWRIDAGRGFLGAPRVRAPVAVAAHTGRAVIVRETADGEVYWQRRFRTPITGITVADGVVYFAERARRGTVHALALTDGAEQWTARVRHAAHAPVTIDGLVVLSTDAGELVAFDDQGDVRWETPLGGVLALPPSHAFAGLAATTIGDTLYFVAADGSITDRTPLPATPSAPLLATEDGLVVPLHDGSIITIENDRTVGQRLDVGDVVLAQPVRDARGGIVVLTRAGKLWRISDGTLTPIADLEGAATRSLVRVANGYVVGLLDGTVALIDDDGTVRWRYAAQESVDEPVAVEQDALYIATRRGTLVKLTECGMGNAERLECGTAGMRNGEWGMGNGWNAEAEWGMGNRSLIVLVLVCVLIGGARPAAAQVPSAVAPFAGDARLTTAQQASAVTPFATKPRSALRPTPAHARAAAQRAEQRVSAVVSVGKWVTLGAAAASAVYGFSESRRADDLYDALERDCQTSPGTCRGRDESGRYLDAEFESRYQDVLGIDRRTRQALVVSQASLLVSAVLFVLDLRGDGSRPDVPYTPPRLIFNGVELR